MSEQCWNEWCISQAHPGDDYHVDATGFTWYEVRGERPEYRD